MRQKVYREKNKEKIRERQKIAYKKHYEANKEKISEQKKLVIDCECGNNYTFGNKHRHLQSKTHIDYQNQLVNIFCFVKT